MNTQQQIRTSPGENAAALVVAHSAVAGPGRAPSPFPPVRKADNFDRSDVRLVTKGKTVADGALRGKVTKVSRGTCMVDWAGGLKRSCEYCRTVTVLDI